MNAAHPTMMASLRALPRPVWILFFGTFLNKFGTFVMPFLAIYMTSLGYSSAQAGLAIASYGCGVLCASILGGYLADHLGRRKTIVLSMFSGAVAMLCLSQAHTLGTFAVFASLAGLTCELYRPASSALLADLVPAGQRVTAPCEQTERCALPCVVPRECRADAGTGARDEDVHGAPVRGFQRAATSSDVPNALWRSAHRARRAPRHDRRRDPMR